jgi:hypothetical protein
VKYFVSPPAPTSWRLEPEQFRSAVVQQWPDARVREITDPSSTAALDVRLDLEGKPVDGTLARDGQAIALEADVHASARFARWLRSIVPSTQALVFYDEGYSADVPLTPDTTEEQLTRPFLVH